MTLFRYSMLAGVGILIVMIAPIRGEESVAVPESRASDIDQKLKSIVVSIDFTNANIDQAIRALAVVSKLSDPDHKGVVFLVTPEASASGKPITLRLDNVPLGAALHYVSLLGRVHYKIDERLVSIVPAWGGGCGMAQRTFHVDPDFVGLSSTASVKTQ